MGTATRATGGDTMSQDKPPALYADSTYLAALAGLGSGVAEAKPLGSAKCSIAVLPFDNMSGDPEQQYFSDGITEDIITELSRFRELTVVSRTSSFAFRGKAAPVAEVARQLRVQYIVEGSIRKSTDRVRITAQLTDAHSDEHIWAERYDRDLKDVFALQDEVVHRVTGTLVGRLENEKQQRAKQQSSSELKAYDIYLRAREHFFRWSLLENRKAAELLEAALAIEPDYAAARAVIRSLLPGLVQRLELRP